MLSVVCVDISLSINVGVMTFLGISTVYLYIVLGSKNGHTDHGKQKNDIIKCRGNNSAVMLRSQ